MSNSDHFTYQGRTFPVGANVSLETNSWKFTRGGNSQKQFVGTIHAVFSYSFDLQFKPNNVVDGKQSEIISLYYSDIKAIALIDGMEKSNVLENILTSANLNRAAYEISEHVSDVYGEDLFEILDAHERMESRPLARVTYEEHSQFCDGKEAYVIYIDPHRKNDWGMDMAFPLVNDMVSYQLVTKIRELMKQGYEVIWR